MHGVFAVGVGDRDLAAAVAGLPTVDRESPDVSNTDLFGADELRRRGFWDPWE
ncbi:hypothetical protein MAHJHV48_47970 [Mycobacterium avium subsp. hominissuis]